MQRIGKIINCDYPGCTEQIVVEAKTAKQVDDWDYRTVTYERTPEGWATVLTKDLCPKHYAQYRATLRDFWNPSTETDKFAEDMEAALTDDDILYTNMKGIKVTTPDGTVEARKKEDW